MKKMVLDEHCRGIEITIEDRGEEDNTTFLLSLLLCLGHFGFEETEKQF